MGTKARGARVLALARGPEKGALCRALGADQVIDPAAGPDPTGWVDAVRDATGGRGARPGAIT